MKWKVCRRKYYL